MSKQDFYEYLGLTKQEEEHLEVTDITCFSDKEFELYKRQHEKRNQKVYKLLFYLTRWDDKIVFAQSAKVEHGGYAKKDLMDAFIKKWRNEEKVVHRFIGNNCFSVYNELIPYSVEKDFYFEIVIEGYVSRFEVDTDEKVYKIYITGDLIRMKLEYNYEN